MQPRLILLHTTGTYIDSLDLPTTAPLFAPLQLRRQIMSISPNAQPDIFFLSTLLPPGCKSLAPAVPLLAPSPGVSMPILGFGVFRVEASDCASASLPCQPSAWRRLPPHRLGAAVRQRDEAEMGPGRAGVGRAAGGGVSHHEDPLPGLPPGPRRKRRVTDSVRKISGAAAAGKVKGKGERKDAEAEEEKEGEGDECADLFLVHTPYGGKRAQRHMALRCRLSVLLLGVGGGRSRFWGSWRENKASLLPRY